MPKLEEKFTHPNSSKAIDKEKKALFGHEKDKDIPYEGGGLNFGAPTGMDTGAKKSKAEINFDNPSGLEEAAEFEQFMDDESGKKKGILKGKFTKPIIAGGGVAAVGIISWSTFLQGPLQFVHASQLLQQFHFAGLEETSDSRAVRIWRYLRDPSNPENRRLGELGKRYANKIDTRLQDAGFEIDHKRGNFRKLLIDPDASNKTLTEVRNDLDDTDGSKVNYETVDGKQVIAVEYDRFEPFKKSRAINYAIKNSSYTKKTSWMAARTLKKRSNVGFHVLGQLDNAARDLAADTYQKAKDDYKERRNKRIKEGKVDAQLDFKGQEVEAEDGTRTEDPRAREAADTNKALDTSSPSKLKTSLKVGGGATMLAGVACAAQSVAGAVDSVNYENVNLPLIRLAMETISIGGQIQAGQEVDMAELAILVEQFYEEGGTMPDALDEGTVTVDPSSWVDANDIRSELGEDQIGVDVPPELKIASDPNFVSSFFNSLPGFISSPLSSFCSFSEGIVGTITMLAFDVVTGPVSGTIGFVGGELFGDDAINAIINWASNDPVDLEVAGANYGSYINIGARMAANEQFKSMGGAELTSSQTAKLDSYIANERALYDKDQGWVHRFASIENPNSFLSNIARKMPADTSSTMASILKAPATVLSSINKVFPSSKSYAQANPGGFDYGFSEFGFSLEDLNDERFENPYKNEAALGTESEINELHNKWGKCFGVDVDSSGRLSINKGVSDSEIKKDPDCSMMFSDTPESELFKRYRFYILDTVVLKSMSCYEGDEQSCEELGNGGSSNSSANSLVGGGIIDGVQCPDNIEPHPSIAGYFKMPDAPNGEYTFYSSKRYGSQQLICVLHTVGVAYHGVYGEKSKLDIGDLNASGHKSHYKGVAVDLDARNKTGSGENIWAADHQNSGSNYSAEATIVLGKLFVDTGAIKNIWWCERRGDGSIEAIKSYAQSKGTPINIKCIAGHKNHFHVDIKDEYALPGRYEP